MANIGAAFTVRFLRNSDQIYLVRNIAKEGGEGAGLYQIVDPTSQAVVPDWSVASDQPIISLEARSAYGYPVSITQVEWFYQGTEINFGTLNESNFVAADGNKPFSSKLVKSGGMTIKHLLRITGNIASASALSNRQITYKVHFTSNGTSDVIEGSVDILIQQAGSDSHMLQITTNKAELDSANPNTTLSAQAYYGTTPVTIGQGGYTIEWYKGTQKIEGQTNATLTITRDDVDGGSIYVAKLLKNGSPVAQDAQRINDIADEYQIQFTPVNGKTAVSSTQDAQYRLSLLKNGTPQSGLSPSYQWEIFNALGVRNGTGTGATITITASHCLCGSGETQYYSDCDVSVSATIN